MRRLSPTVRDVLKVNRKAPELDRYETVDEENELKANTEQIASEHKDQHRQDKSARTPSPQYVKQG